MPSQVGKRQLSGPPGRVLVTERDAAWIPGVPVAEQFGHRHPWSGVGVQPVRDRRLGVCAGVRV
jgi:hypothetical protein